MCRNFFLLYIVCIWLVKCCICLVKCCVVSVCCRLAVYAMHGCVIPTYFLLFAYNDPVIVRVAFVVLRP